MPDRSTSMPAESTDRGALWLFVHIPKTAGSSFRSALAQELRPEHNINIAGLNGLVKRQDAFRQAIEEFLALDRDQRFSFASGHLRMREVRRIQKRLGRPVKLLTMLREPVQRVISDYRYQRTPAHPTHEVFRAAYPTLESFVDSKRSQNKMMRHLALPGESVDEVIARVERDFSFVGVAESYALSVQICSDLIGPRFSSATTLNITQSTDGNAVEVDDEFCDRIRRLNGDDQRLWTHFSRRLRRSAASASGNAAAGGLARPGGF